MTETSSSPPTRRRPASSSTASSALGRVVPFARPLPVEVALEDGCCVLSREEYDLLVVAPTLTEAIEGWFHELPDAAKIRFDPSVGVPGIGTGL